jgi:uncharacterized membrane protein YuzA (DUF378 family)
MKEMNPVSWVAFVLVIVGGLNWGLVGLFKYNLVDKIFGVDSGLARVVYALVGLATLVLLGMVAMSKSAKSPAA